MITHVEYDTNGWFGGPNAGSAYGALIEGKAICRGYTDAMILLLNLTNIKCIHVESTDTRVMAGHM